MSTLRIAIEGSCSPARFMRQAAGLLDTEGNEPVLLLARLTGSTVSLGRFQRASAAVEPATLPTALRRIGGGKSLLLGEGVLGLALALPSMGALLTENVGPERLINRYTRGLLAGLSSVLTTPTHYFGRDFVAADRRRVASLSQDGLPSGRVLFEAYLAVSSPLTLPPGVSRYPIQRDPRSGVPEDVTMTELASRPLQIDEVIQALVSGYARAYGCVTAPLETALVEGPDPQPPVREDERGWSWSGRAEVPIGYVEALVRHDGRTLRSVRLRGDFIAPAYVFAELETTLVGCPLVRGELAKHIVTTLRKPGATLLGVIDPLLFADAILATVPDLT